MKRVISFVLALALVCTLLPMMKTTASATTLDLDSLPSATFLSNGAHRTYIDGKIKYYLQNNSSLVTALENGKSVIMMFEGGSDNYPWHGYSASGDNYRDQAVVIVLQKKNNAVQIVFYSQDCSSIPSQPEDRTNNQTTILDGIYKVFTLNHLGQYGALQVNTDKGYYVSSSDKNGWVGSAAGINIHTRSTKTAESGSGAWSAGCQLIGTGNTSDNVFNNFMKAVVGIDYNVWTNYSSKQFKKFTEAEKYKDVGYYVLDRQLALDGLKEMYSDYALSKITAASANNDCNVSFNTNGGSSFSSATVTPGSSFTIPSTVPAKFGYDFTGWATSATGSATYQPGDTITISQDTTLYAVWYKTSHRVSTRLSGTATIKYPGVGNYVSFTVETDGTYEIKGLIGSDGYVDSVAWLYDSEGYGIATDDDSGGNGLFRIEAELEAGEEYILYMKAYDSSFTGWFNWRISALEEQIVGTTINDKYLGWATVSEPGSMDYYLFTPTVSDTYVIYSFGDTDSMVYLYDSKGVQLASDDDGGDNNNFRLTYYMTAGTTYQFGIKLFNSSATGVVDFAFGKVYNLTYDANGGSNAPASQQCDFGRALRLSNSVPTRDGYSFFGWAGSADASYAMWQPGQSINIGADSTLYAVWEPHITTGIGHAVISTPGSSVYYTFTAPADRTYVIYSIGDLDSKVNLYDNNWVLLASDDDGGDNHNFRLQYDMTEGKTYHFEIALYSSSATGTVDYMFGRTYKVSYDANGGSMAPSTQYRDTGSTLVLSESVPVRGEYTFLGWATVPDATSAEYQPGDGFVGIWDTTLYAVWEKETQICEHTNRQVSVSVWPSTLTTGTLARTCISCTDVETVTLPKFNTTDYTYSVVRAATCTRQGVGRYTWKNTEYGEQFFNVAIPAGHTYEATLTAPTCTEQGYTTHTCDCGDSYVDSYVSALGHSFTDYKSNNDATVDKDGTETAKCDRCEVTHTRTQEGSAIGHNYTAKVTAPTCTEQGYTTHTCDCGDSYVDSYVSALGHSYTHYVTATAATCATGGTETAKCDRCESVDTRNVSALGHLMINVPEVKPTCTETGLTAGTKCDRCGVVGTQQSEIAATGHSYEDGVCTVCGDCSEKFTYTIENGKATITGYEGQLSGEIVIPETLGGCPVVALGNSAFYGNTGITGVTIPDSVTSIGWYTFYNCRGLTYVKLGKGITNIEWYTFKGCSNLATINIPASVTSIGTEAFADCSGLTDVYVTDPVNWCKISFASYSSNPAYLSDNLHFVDEAGNSVTKIVLDDSVTSLPSSGFLGSNITSIFIPNSVTRIKDGAFYRCNDLRNVYYAGSETEWQYIRVDTYNELLDDAQIHYNHEHDYSDQVIDTEAATCTAQGYCEGYCTCGRFGRNMIPELDHSFTNYISNNDATYEADGTKTAKCDRCEETDTVTDPGTKIPRQDGWLQEDGVWYFYEAGEKHTGWLNTNGVWYYMDTDGIMQTGWKQVNGYWYYFESNGVMATNAWKKDSKGWCYLGSNGAMRTNAWVQDSKGWCYVGEDGYCWTNKWAKDSKGWIWLDSEGSMTKSKWIQYNGAWYYLDSEGYMATGWQKINNNWYYLGTNGVMTTGWQKVNNTWYYMASNGVMTTGWQKVNNNWYYMGTNGAMVTGWVQIGSTWYYLHSSGVMATGTVKIGAKTYTFASNGVWIS